MQNAKHILQAIGKLGEKRIPLTRVYRNLYSEDLFLKAYAKLYRNQGALTPGVDDDTADGMSIERIRNLIELLRYERFHFRPVRRSQIPKKRGGTRPLGIPNFSDKLVQETLRLILEAYYEPRFRDSSHGFRSGRGCHTALAYLKRKFVGTTWLIEGDIRGCFENINHDILLRTLSRDIKDGRLIELIRRSLKAGVMEEWQYHRTYSGTPQGGVLSPILANIYLNELDAFIEDELIPQYTRGQTRKLNPAYRHIQHKLSYARKKGNTARIKELRRELRKLPTYDTHDPNFRRLKYVRYADDFILGFIGPKAEAEQIKASIREFLQESLRIQLNDEKTLITHARTEQAQFLGYAISIYHSDTKLGNGKGGSKARSINGKVRLGIPYGLVDDYCKRYQRHGKPVSDTVLLENSDAHIIDTFQQRYRGVAEYYKYAIDRGALNKLKYVMQVALVKTLAHKFKIRASKVYAKYRGTVTHSNGQTYKTLQVEVPTKRSSRLVYWGAIPLTVVKTGTEALSDTRYQEWWTVRSDLVQRLQANECELCGSTRNVEVHHIRKLADLKKQWAGKSDTPLWVKRMAKMQRKTLVVCNDCHNDIHAGKLSPKKSRK